MSFHFIFLCLLQAFLEMASEEAAVTMVNYYTPITPHLRSQPVYIQYSNHRELKTDNLPNQAVSIKGVFKNRCGNTWYDKLHTLQMKQNYVPLFILGYFTSHNCICKFFPQFLRIRKQCHLEIY